MSDPFVSVERANELERDYVHKRWMAFAYLAAALVAASAIAITAYQLWDSWLLGIAVIIFGPLAIAWLMSRMNPKD